MGPKYNNMSKQEGTQQLYPIPALEARHGGTPPVLRGRAHTAPVPSSCVHTTQSQALGGTNPSKLKGALPCTAVSRPAAEAVSVARSYHRTHGKPPSLLFMFTKHRFAFLCFSSAKTVAPSHIAGPPEFCFFSNLALPRELLSEAPGALPMVCAHFAGSHLPAAAVPPPPKK